MAIVQNACVGRNSCNVWASNSVFGDPCFGTYKRLYIVGKCSAACNPPAAANAGITQLDATRWRWSCNAGYYSANVDRDCRPDGSFSGAAISCSPCPVGSWCEWCGTGAE